MSYTKQFYLIVRYFVIVLMNIYKTLKAHILNSKEKCKMPKKNKTYNYTLGHKYVILKLAESKVRFWRLDCKNYEPECQ